VIKIHEGRYVSSLDLHEILSITTRYDLWIRMFKNNVVLEDGKDYRRNHNYENKNPRKRGKKSHDYYITVTVASAICIKTGTVLSKRVKIYLDSVLK
jgi:phage anti-repressor protein